jgi:hypothetical protein
MQLGEGALMGMEAGCCIAMLITLKTSQVKSYGGQAAWDALSADKKAGADAQLIHDIGKQIFDGLSEGDQEQLT